MILNRKVYAKLLAWKEECNGNRALLAEGARRIGKSTICEEFGKNEYETYKDFEKRMRRHQQEDNIRSNYYVLFKRYFNNP